MALKNGWTNLLLPKAGTMAKRLKWPARLIFHVLFPTSDFMQALYNILHLKATKCRVLALTIPCASLLVWWAAFRPGICRFIFLPGK